MLTPRQLHGKLGKGAESNDNYLLPEYFSSQPDQHHYGGNRKCKIKGMGHSISLRCYRTAADFFLMAQGCNTMHINTLNCSSISRVQIATSTLSTGVADLSLHSTSF